MSVILVTGANGQLGKELKRLSGNFLGYRFILTDYPELDITRPESIRKYLDLYRPGWIINCAAYNFVDRAETETEKAFSINSHGVRNITEAIGDSLCRLIHFSTDYVFDGKKKAPYTESDKPAPLSHYGESKLEGEKFALKHPWSMVIRTSWLYSDTGSNFVKTIIRKAKEEGLLKVVTDQVGSPTWAADLASALIKIISSVDRQDAAFNGGIYHYSNKGACSWYEFAKSIVKLAGIECSIEPVESSHYPSVAVRPSFSVLDTKKITDNYGIAIPSWEESLAKCIKLMKRNKII
ncbi:MAG: dTDP-4-dehydrorhamnose reductase [Bacteroidales bacterium]|nr:dTDP-4-dehydrorhamnose reductase [Bacteroidales bacterium]